MSRRLIIQEDAIQDLDDISAYIGEENARASVRFLKATRKACNQIAAQPGIGALRDYGNPALVGLRVMLVPSFRSYGIYYLTTSESVIVLRVIHGARDLDAIFAPKNAPS